MWMTSIVSSRRLSVGQEYRAQRGLIVRVRTDGERDQRLVRVGLDAQVVYDGPDGVVRITRDTGGTHRPRPGRHLRFLHSAPAEDRAAAAISARRGHVTHPTNTNLSTGVAVLLLLVLDRHPLCLF